MSICCCSKAALSDWAETTKLTNETADLGTQEPWVDFCTHKCDQDPLRTTSLSDIIQVHNGLFFIVFLKERMVGIFGFKFFECSSINTKDKLYSVK